MSTNLWGCMGNIYGHHLGRAHGWCPLPVSSFLLHVPSPSLLLFLGPFCNFVHLVSPHPLWSFVCLCVCLSAFFGRKKAECLWSINPLNAIKHTMHRRWPFKSYVHSLRSRSCSRAIGSSPSRTSSLSMSIVDKVIVSFDLLDVRSSNFYREEEIIHCLMLKSNQSIQRSGPCWISVFSLTVALGPKPTQIYQVWPMRAYVPCPCVKYCAFPIIMMYN